MNMVLRDLRYALRMLVKSPSFTLVTLLTLALGIGANTAIFSVVNAVLLRPLPYNDPGRLAILWTDNVRQNLHEERTSYPNFEDWRKQNRVFEDMAFLSAFTVNLTAGDEAERIVAGRTSANLFSLMGVHPILGRTFSPEEEQRSERVIVLSYGLWQRRFAGSKEVIGKTLEVDGVNLTVVGVMPRAFQLPTIRTTELWEPLALFPNWNTLRTQRGIPSGFVVGRLKPKVRLDQAQAEMKLVGRRLERQYPELARNIDFFGFGVNVVPLEVQVTGREVRLSLWLLFGAAVLVLLIACTNVVQLLLSRGTVRARELAIRTALGAGRACLIRQLLTESALLYLASGFLGLLFAAAGIGALVRSAPQDIPRLDEVGIDGGVFAFALGLSLLAGTLFGLVPALRASGADPQQALKEGRPGLSDGVRGRRTRGLLVVAEFVLAVILLAGAGLLIRSFLRVQAVDPGFRPDRVLIARVVQAKSKSDAQWAEFYTQALERIKTIPEVEAAAAIDSFFFSSNPDDAVIPEGQEPPASGKPVEQVMDDGISPGYFQAVGVPLLLGRFFSEQDRADSLRVAIVNRTMARRFWPGEDPVGKRLKFSFQKSSDAWTTIVGVVGDMRRDDLTKEPVSQVFLPLTQDPARGMDLIVRTASDPLKLVTAVRSAVRSVDRTAPLFDIGTLEQRLGEQTAPRRFRTFLLSLFSALALLLAAIGIYGLMHYAVSQRTHEIGVRMALGARASHVLFMVLRQGFVLALAGVAVGLIGALWLTESMATLLLGVTPDDPATFACVAVLLTGVALVASYIPARRAAKVSPMVALRCE